MKNKPFVENKDNDLCDDEIVSAESWENYLKRNQSIIVDHFSGQYKSTLICPDCNRVSITFDPFLIASLPIPSMDYSDLIVYVIFRDPKRTPVKLQLNLFSFITVDTLLKRIGKYLKIDDHFLEMCWIKDFLIREIVPKSTLIKQFVKIEGVLFIYEKHIPEPQIIYKKNEFINAELQILQKNYRKKESFNKNVAFTRIFDVGVNMTFSQIHLEIYKLYRNNIRILYKNLKKWQSNQNFAKFEFKTQEEEESNPNLINIESEYGEIFLKTNKDLVAPYSLYILKRKNEKNSLVELLPFNNTILSSILKEISFHDQIKLQIVFEPSIKVEEIKLTICEPDRSHQNINDVIKKHFTIQECFELFTREEKLDKENEWFCNKCKGHKQATKKMELYKLPEILILHLKRFKTARIGSYGSLFFPAGSTKINSLVEFPIDEIDMEPFCKKKNQKTKYQLIGVSNHFGEMGGGHYTAYCKNFFNKKWYEFDDARVSNCKIDEIVSKAAYMLFYQKLE